MTLTPDIPRSALVETPQQNEVQTQSATGPVAPPSVATPPRAHESTVLITEDEVRFATAVARGLPKQDRRWVRFRQIVAGLAASRNDAADQHVSGPRRHHPRRMPYLENALMSREMDRL